jgi:RNA polymerase sigma-70 factor (ECF subfamily)
MPITRPPAPRGSSADERGTFVERAGGVQPTAPWSERIAVSADPGETFVAALWDEHGDALLGYVTRLVGDPGRAEDIVQEVMLRAWRHAGSLDTEGRSLRPWLFTVAGHLAADHHRARRSRPELLGAEALDHRSVGDGIDRAVDAWEVKAAFGALSQEHRGVLLETYYRGRSVAEAATALGVPEGTVKSRTYYALRALRLALEERGWRP